MKLDWLQVSYILCYIMVNKLFQNPVIWNIWNQGRLTRIFIGGASGLSIQIVKGNGLFNDQIVGAAAPPQTAPLYESHLVVSYAIGCVVVK